MSKVRAGDIGQLDLELATERQVGRHGSCSTGVHEGREAVMPGLGLEIDLAECEDLCSLPGGDDGISTRRQG